MVLVFDSGLFAAMHLCFWCYFQCVCFVFQNDLDDPERGMIFVCSATHKTKVSIHLVLLSSTVLHQHQPFVILIFTFWHYHTKTLNYLFLY